MLANPQNSSKVPGVLTAKASSTSQGTYQFRPLATPTSFRMPALAAQALQHSRAAPLQRKPNQCPKRPPPFHPKQRTSVHTCSHMSHQHLAIQKSLKTPPNFRTCSVKDCLRTGTRKPRFQDQPPYSAWVPQNSRASKLTASRRCASSISKRYPKPLAYVPLILDVLQGGLQLV